MAKNYKKMYTELGLDLKAHELLLTTLSKFYSK